MRATGRVFVASGHGVDDVGATADGLVERDVNATVAARLTRRLEDHGIDVVSDLDHDNPGFPAEAELAHRIGSIEYYIAVHHNSATNGAARGAEVFAGDQEGRSLAGALHRAQVDALRMLDPELPDRGVKAPDGTGAAKHIAAAPGAVAVLEPCFLSSPEDRLMVRRPDYADVLSEAWCRALVDHGRLRGSWTTTYERCDVELNPVFSVIVATCDRPQLVREAVGSILEQSVTDIEIIVVDDGVRTAAPDFDDDRVRVLRPGGGRGPGAARNSGIDAARGRYVAFLDDDDLWTRDRLDLALAGLERAPISVCRTRHMGQRGETRHRMLEGNVGARLLDDTTPCLGATAAERTVVPRFEERWLAIEDVVWWWRLADRAEVTTVSEVGYLVRLHEGERGRNPNAARVEENLRFLTEERAFFQANRTAAAHRWRRVSLLALEDRNYTTAIRAGVRSFLLAPRIPGPARRFVRRRAPGMRRAS